MHLWEETVRTVPRGRKKWRKILWLFAPEGWSGAGRSLQPGPERGLSVLGEPGDHSTRKAASSPPAADWLSSEAAGSFEVSGIVGRVTQCCLEPTGGCVSCPVLWCCRAHTRLAFSSDCLDSVPGEHGTLAGRGRLSVGSGVAAWRPRLFLGFAPAFSLWYFANKAWTRGQKVQLKIVSADRKCSSGSGSIREKLFTLHFHFLGC